MRGHLLLLTILVSARTGNAQRPTDRAVGYVLEGTVRDSLTQRPVAGVYIWPLFRSWGAVTDREGRYRLRWPQRADWLLLVRQCDDRNLARVSVTFRDSLVIQRDVVISASGEPCPGAIRPPWVADERDTTSFRGHYIYSWEGGGWLASCDGRTFHMDWDSPLGPTLRDRRTREGQHTFVRARGRVAEDGLNITFPGPLFVVAKVDSVREPQPTDCR